MLIKPVQNPRLRRVLAALRLFGIAVWIGLMYATWDYERLKISITLLGSIGLITAAVLVTSSFLLLGSNLNGTTSDKRH